MASVKLVLMDSPSKQLKDGSYPIYLRLTHNRKRKYYTLNTSCISAQWNKGESVLNSKYKRYKKENDALDGILTKAKDIVREFKELQKPFTINAFETKFLGRSIDKNLKSYFGVVAKELFENGQLRTSETYSETYNIIKRFLEDSSKYSVDITLIDVDYKFLLDFEKWMRRRGNKDTTISFYLRTLRAVIRRAIKEKVLSKEYYPFDEYRIGERLNTRTQKRAITKDQVKQIKELDIPSDSPLKLARDIFIFSYFTRGMNFIDISYLTTKDIFDGRITYTRRKTNKPFNIKILPPVQAIIDYYLDYKINEGDYVFPVYDNSKHKTEKQKSYRRKKVLKSINHNLKEIGKIIELNGIKLTTYVARHSYANHLKQNKFSISLISESLGHSSEEITRTYLKEFENEELDKADESLLF